MIVLFVFDNNKYNKNNEKEYNTIIKEIQGTLTLELGKIIIHKPKPKKKLHSNRPQSYQCNWS